MEGSVVWDSTAWGAKCHSSSHTLPCWVWQSLNRLIRAFAQPFLLLLSQAGIFLPVTCRPLKQHVCVGSFADFSRRISHWIPPCGAVSNWTNLSSRQESHHSMEQWYMGTGKRLGILKPQFLCSPPCLPNLEQDGSEKWGWTSCTSQGFPEWLFVRSFSSESQNHRDWKSPAGFLNPTCDWSSPCHSTECHVHSFLGHLQGWEFHHLPVPDHPFHEESSGRSRKSVCTFGMGHRNSPDQPPEIKALFSFKLHSCHPH